MAIHRRDRGGQALALIFWVAIIVVAIWKGRDIAQALGL